MHFASYYLIHEMAIAFTNVQGFPKLENEFGAFAFYLSQKMNFKNLPLKVAISELFKCTWLMHVYG